METLGQKMRAAREKKRVTLSKAAAMTRIKIQHLEMMENDDFSKMPAPTYAKGFIRIYATFLGLDSAPLVQEYVDRHLNGPAPEAAKNDAAVPEDTAPEPSGKKKLSISWPGAKAQLLLVAKNVADALRPHLSRIGIALGIVVLVMLVSRCMSGIGSDEAEAEGKMMRSQSIAREPAERYLDLPAGGNNP